METISAALTFGDALAALLTKAIPSDAQRLEAFKVRYPDLYWRTRKHLIVHLYRTLKNWHQTSLDDIKNWVEFTCKDLSKDEQTEVETIILNRFSNK